MHIDGLNLDLRERNAWEAFDLGVALARTTGWKLFLPYSIVFILLALVIHLGALAADVPFWAALVVLWWVKPAVDRVALAVLGQAVFGAAPDWRTTMRSLRSIPRAGWLMSFTFGRFDFARSFHLPVRQLEGQTGKAGRDRIRVLDKKLRGHAVWLTVAIWHFVFVLIYGANVLIEMLAPTGTHAGMDWSFLFDRGEETLGNQALFSTLLVLAECLLEPIYIAAGFALYLSRRTALEGWDLEVAFKRMAARIDEQQRAAQGLAPALDKSGNKLVAALLVLGMGLLLGAVAAPQPSWAQQPSENKEQPAKDADKSADEDEDDEDKPALVPPPAAAPAASATAAPAGPPSAEQKAIREVLAKPEFEEYGKEKTWRYRGKPEARDDKPFRFGDGWASVIRFIGELLRGAIWVLAILVLAWLLVLLSRHFGWFKGALNFKRAKPDVMFGMDLRPESLPDDVPGAARALLAAGNPRGALALLYRASLSFLVHERDIEISVGDTEGDCVRRAEKAGPLAMAQYFRGLVDAWGRTAYAARTPERSEIEALIQNWAKHFTPPETAPAGSAGARPATGAAA
jgi:hypothetical protein